MTIAEKLPPYMTNFHPFWEDNDMYTEETKKKLRKQMKK